MTVSWSKLQNWKNQDCKEKLNFINVKNELKDREAEAYKAGHTEGFEFCLNMLKLHYGLEVSYK